MFGLGDIDPNAMTTAMTMSAIAQGFVALEAPELNLRLYGTKEKSLYTQTFCRYHGCKYFICWSNVIMPFHPGIRSQEGHWLVSIGYILVSFITRGETLFI